MYYYCFCFVSSPKVVWVVSPDEFFSIVHDESIYALCKIELDFYLYLCDKHIISFNSPFNLDRLVFLNDKVDYYGAE